MDVQIAALFAGLQRYLAEAREHRNHVRTQRFLASLPDDIRKDVGWPDVIAAPAESAHVEPKRRAESFQPRMA